MFLRDGRMCLKKDERRGWSYDRVVEMINGVDPSWKENDLQTVGSGKTVSEGFFISIAATMMGQTSKIFP